MTVKLNQKLQPGDTIMVIAPSLSMALNKPDKNEAAKNRIEKELGLKVIYADNSHEFNDFASSSVESRVADLHQAFSSPEVKAIFCAKGGYNANQLLDKIDYELIAKNPKIFMGYSDCDVLNNAIYAKTGIITYLAPTFSFFGKDKVGIDYSIEYLKKCLFSEDSFELQPSKEYTYEVYDENKPQAQVTVNPGWAIVREGKASGTIIGGNLCTFNLLHGTEYMPEFQEDTILFLEDDDLAGEYTLQEFERNLISVTHQKDFSKVKGLVIGRFQPTSKVEMEKLLYVLKSHSVLAALPIIANVDFGHTCPLSTIPIGGTVEIKASLNGDSYIRIINHL